MRRICIAAILVGTFSASASAQSLRPSYAPDGRSQSAQSVNRVVHTQKVTLTTAPKSTPSRAAPVPLSEGALAAQTYATPAAVPPPSNRGLRDFFATIFAGPTMLAHALRPGESTYYYATPGTTSPAYGSSAYAPQAYGSQAYASPNQADARDGPIDPKFLRLEVAYPGREAPGTIIVDTANKFLYLIETDGRALRYGIGVGRPGFLWAGVKTVTAKREWPDWRPPAEMLARRPDLPRFMPGGIDNPLGARALYLGSSLYRIHGSNEPGTIGTNVSSGCIRMRNEDVTDLYQRVKVGTKVVVI
jgi:lipoprotein-anchoring transpeptidase ErfK/SrfK